MTTVVLCTFQSLTRVDQIHAEGVLLDGWRHAHGDLVCEASRAMVVEMVCAGVDTDGAPPIWAGRGELTLTAAHSLFAEHELAAGQAACSMSAASFCPSRRPLMPSGSSPPTRRTAQGPSAVAGLILHRLLEHGLARARPPCR